MLTERLELRPPREEDRDRIVELFREKQPVIDLATSRIVGYSGVAWFEFEGFRRLEFGYRLVPKARGRGYRRSFA